MIRALVCMAVAAVGCSLGTKSDAGGAAVLEVGTRSFSAGDLKTLVDEQPEALRSHYRTPSGRAAFIEQLIRTELLVQEAQRKDLDKEASVRQMYDRLLVQKLVEQIELPPPTDAQLNAAYQTARNEFVRPDRLHVRAIFWERGTGAAVEKSAQAVKGRIAAVKPAAREAAFEAVARTQSALLSSRDSGGDLGPRTPEDLAVLFGKGIENAASQLQQPGQMSDLIETERGFVLLFLRGRQPGLIQTFESVKSRLAQRLLAIERTKTIEQLVERLKRETTVRLNESLADAG